MKQKEIKTFYTKWWAKIKQKANFVISPCCRGAYGGKSYGIHFKKILKEKLKQKINN